MTGIPFAHATCVIMSEHKDAEDYVSSYFSVENYKKAYNYTLTPLADHSQWSIPSSQGESLPILPPPFRKQIGRPRKVRKKGIDEVSVGGKVTRRGTVQSCSNCGDLTHNKRRCKKPPSQKPPSAERPRKRNKTTSSAVGVNSSTPHHNTRARSNFVSNSQQAIGPSTQPVRGQRSKRPEQRSNRSGKKNGLQSGIGNWNGLGMFNQFRPPMQSGANNGSQVQINNFSDGGNIQMQVQNTTFGNVLFSSQSRSNRFAVITDNGET